MVFDLDKLRKAAAVEQSNLDRAAAALRSALDEHAALDADATLPSIRRAVDNVRVAGDKLDTLPDLLVAVLHQATPDEVLGALERDVPLVLLPVRLETRLLPAAGRWQLLVRVYPDALHVDSHEPELTVAEEQAGLRMWTAPADQQPAIWAGLVDLLGPGRVAWAAEATRDRPRHGRTRRTLRRPPPAGSPARRGRRHFRIGSGSPCEPTASTGRFSKATVSGPRSPPAPIRVSPPIRQTA